MQRVYRIRPGDLETAGETAPFPGPGRGGRIGGSSESWRIPMRTALAAALLTLAALPGAALAGDETGAGGKRPTGGSSAPAPEGGKDWSKHVGDIPFIIGREAGMKEVEFTGKPILFFYTTTW